MRSSFFTAIAMLVAAVTAQPILKERNGSASVKDIQCWCVRPDQRTLKS